MNQGYDSDNNNQSTMNGMPANNMQASSVVDSQNPVVQVLQDGTQVLLDGTKIFKDGGKELPDGTKILADGTKIVDTNGTKENGQNKCPMCGSTEVRLNVNKGTLVCEFCRHEFSPEKISGMVDDISKLEGQVVASGATNIAADSKDVMTFKCGSCGAEVVIDTTESTQARCHWCRNILSLNQQVPNGAVPDVVLPVAVKKEIARAKIEEFVGKRKFFAHPKFRAEFTTENIMGVYFPYMVVDVNAHSNLSGEGEHLVRSYRVSSGDNSYTCYDADLYHVERDFDITINGLTVESNSERLNNASTTQTNNIINSIMPFDIENCVKYDSHFLKGYTSEKRDTNIGDLKGLVETQSKDIARFAANETLLFYDRGVAWSKENITVKGQQWKAAYLPVWLYSYQQVSPSGNKLHYVAVNARTLETMGSVPIHQPKLLITSVIVEILGILSMMWIDFEYNWIFLFLGFAFYGIMYARYRNSGARHHHETETKRNISNVKAVDDFIKHEKGLRNSHMIGANNRLVSSSSSGSSFTEKMSSVAKARFNIQDQNNGQNNNNINK